MCNVCAGECVCVMCADGCGTLADTERLIGMIGDSECVELVCTPCKLRKEFM